MIVNASVLFYSKTGKTKAMAEAIVQGMNQVEGVQAQAFSIDELDEAYLAQSKVVVVGTPTWHANPCWQIKKFLDESGKLGLAGKLGGAFATADYQQGGPDLAIQTILTHLMVDGMLVYSGGGSFGKPYIHLGPVALRDTFEEGRELFVTFGRRIAGKGLELFGR